MGLFEKKSIGDTFGRLALFGTRSADLQCLGHVRQICSVWDTFGRLAVYGTRSADLQCLGHVLQTCTVWDTFGRLAVFGTRSADLHSLELRFSKERNALSPVMCPSYDPSPSVHRSSWTTCNGRCLYQSNFGVLLLNNYELCLEILFTWDNFNGRG